MLSKVIRFVRLGLLVLLVFALGRFMLGLLGVPYAPRGNAIFSVVMQTIVTALYFGALSKRVGNFSWSGTILTGVTIGVWAQILVFSLTVISFAAGLENSYYLTRDALGIQPPAAIEWVPLLISRAVGFVVNTVIATVFASIGRLLAPLAPSS